MRFLQRALDDLNEGIRSLLGPGGSSRPDLVRELLEGRRSRAPVRRSRPRRARRSRASTKLRLVRLDAGSGTRKADLVAGPPAPTRPW